MKKFLCINTKLGVSIILCSTLFFANCKRLVEVNPPTTSNTGASVFASNATAISAVTGLYTKISAGSTGASGLLTSLSLFGGLSSDELSLYSSVTNATEIAYYQNALTGNTSGYGSEYWKTIYPYIFICNSALEGLGNSGGITPSIAQQLTGESKFMRAFFYFYLTNLYGDLPLVLTTNYKENAGLARSPQKMVYQQIISDLMDAQSLLSSSYLDGTLLKITSDRVRPTQWAAASLLARVYLYTSDWVDAESEATLVINNSSLFSLSSIDTTFLRASLGNNEAIWQLQPVNSGWNTEDAKVFIIPSSGPSTINQTGTYLSSYLLGSFEVNDKRQSHWVGKTVFAGKTYYYPFKYKINTQNTNSSATITEYIMMLRLGEQYLIRAEARAQQGNLGGAFADLNAIRNRAGLGPSTATTQSAILAAILHERQVEMFTELGQRWLDIKRDGIVDSVMETNGVCASKGGSWNADFQWYPLPLNDLQNDLNLVQNVGY